MRIFISYARVDKNFCKQIVDLLDGHDVWYDQRLHIGQTWWDQIVSRLGWCDAMLYLLSPDSVESDYCRRELDVGITFKKHVFPVLIQKDTDIPPNLRQIQYADFSNGLEVAPVKMLLSSLMILERKLKQNGNGIIVNPPPPIIIPPGKTIDGSALLDEALNALKLCDYDKAVRLLKEVQESGYMSRFVDVSATLKTAEAALKRQAYEREAQREYTRVSNLMKTESTRAVGCNAYQAFILTFPDYDPEKLKQIYEQTVLALPPFDPHAAMPLLEWCCVPKGKVVTEHNRSRKTAEIEEFFISKYPVTNAQFQAFVTAPDGYQNSAWWQSSSEIKRWHLDHPKPIDPPPNRDNHPRTNICWYEASAFCQWLSYKTGWTVKLATEQQWQRAAQGDNHWRFAWGTKMDPTLCNTKESETHTTTPVTQYPMSASPYGVCDMLGNAWEWCANGHASGEDGDLTTIELLRAVRGGSYMSSRSKTNVKFHYLLNPLYRYGSIGFRIVCETGGEFLSV